MPPSLQIGVGHSSPASAWISATASRPLASGFFERDPLGDDINDQDVNDHNDDTDCVSEDRNPQAFRTAPARPVWDELIRSLAIAAERMPVIKTMEVFFPALTGAAVRYPVVMIGLRFWKLRPIRCFSRMNSH